MSLKKQRSLQATAPLILYKTKADYSSRVPVRLSSDKKRIVAFPAPQDVKKGELWLTPISMHKGYWLDRQGVGPTTAFLNITYPEYAALLSTPTPEELMQNILENEPFVEMYDCGKAGDYKDPEKTLNTAIQQEKLGQFRSLIE